MSMTIMCGNNTICILAFVCACVCLIVYFEFLKTSPVEVASVHSNRVLQRQHGGYTLQGIGLLL